ncbi:MAG TPA: 2'-5' RNA ligase family protein [Kineosporiaceae bacterium]
MIGSSWGRRAAPRADAAPTPVLGVPVPAPDAAVTDALADPMDRQLGPTTMSMPAIRWRSRDGMDAGAVTIGVALEIPEPWAGYLRSCREGFGDEQARAIPTHVTLLPPTPVSPTRLDQVAAHLETVASGLRPFEVVLEGTDTFRPVSPVVFVRVARGGDRCDTVQRAVRTGPLRRDLTFPFHPHVTVAHHLDDDALDRAAKELSEFTATFTVAAFALYEHGVDGMWRPCRQFRFGGAPVP